MKDKIAEVIQDTIKQHTTKVESDGLFYKRLDEYILTAILDLIAKELPTPKEVIEMMCRHIDGLDHLSFKETDEFAEAIIKDIKHKLGVE